MASTSRWNKLSLNTWLVFSKPSRTCYLQVQLLNSYEEKGGADRVWGGGQWTLHTKGYTELSLCVCALYSVCFSFSFPLRVRVGKHACANVHWSIYFFNFFFFFSCCIDRKWKHAREFIWTFAKCKSIVITFFFVEKEKRWPWWCHILYFRFLAVRWTFEPLRLDFDWWWEKLPASHT